MKSLAWNMYFTITMEKLLLFIFAKSLLVNELFIVFQVLNHKIVKQWLATKSKIMFVLPSNCLLLLFAVTWNFSLTWTWSKNIKELITWETCQVTLIYISGYKNPYYIKQLQSLQTLFKALKPNPQKNL